MQADGKVTERNINKQRFTMKKLTAIVILTVLLLTPLFSRSGGDRYVGLSAGYVYSSISTDTGYKTGQSYAPGHGFSISIPMVFQVHDNIGIETGIDFVQKNFKSSYISVSLSGTMQTYETNINSYIELPLALSLSLTNGRLSATLGAGGYFGFWAASYREGKTQGSSMSLDGEKGDFGYYSGYHEFSDRYDSRFAFGLLFRSSLEYRLDSVVLMLRLSYRMGITDMRKGQKYYAPVMRNNALIAECGIMYNFGGGK